MPDWSAMFVPELSLAEVMARGTILFWSWVLNWASFRSKPLAFLTTAPPLTLFEHGKLDRANMRKALMTREELMQQLREGAGLDDLDQVSRVIMEGDGEVTIIKKEDD